MPDLTPREIQQSVVERYGARARSVLASEGVAPAADACCAPAVDLSAPQPLPLSLDAPAGGLKTLGSLADLGIEGLQAGATCDVDGNCCAPGETFEGTSGSVEGSDKTYGSALYPDDARAVLPESVLAASAGCGNPLAIAELRPGERVLDLGSGGGIDCFLAAREVGPTGEVWGLDMTPDMIALARHNAAKMESPEAARVAFRLGEIEDIPFADGAFDVIMSNCVINLSADKERVFREAHRVLAPGGRLRVSDMVWTTPVPDSMRGATGEWAACVAGALPVEDYLDAIRAAGFLDVAAQYDESHAGVVSAYVTATKG